MSGGLPTNERGSVCLVWSGRPPVRHVHPHRPLNPPGHPDGPLVEDGEFVPVVAAPALVILVYLIIQPGLHTLVHSLTLQSYVKVCTCAANQSAVTGGILSNES